MDPAHIDAFEQHADALRDAVGKILAGADGLRDATDEARIAMNRVDRAVAALRRTEAPEFMGPLHSLSATHQRHRSLSADLERLEAALAQFEDHAREFRILHPRTVAALREKLAKPEDAQ